MVTHEGVEVAGWAAPGPGHWRREVSHFPAGQTPLYRAVYEPSSRLGTAESFARYGLAASHLQMAYVNDRSFVRPVPLLEPPGPLATRPPPAFATWLLSRMLPRFRRRTRAARAALDGRFWRADATHWYEHGRPAAEARNLSLQEEDVERLDDRALAAHVERALANVADGVREHFALVPTTFVPVGDLLAHAVDRGLEPAAVLRLVAGASPASAETAGILRPAADAVARAPVAPRTIDELRALGDDAAAAVDAYLRRFGHRVVGGYDFDAPALHEMPGLVVSAACRLAAAPPAQHGPGGAGTESSPPPPADVPHELVEEARAGYGVRDDNAGPTLQWPAGLARRALLEAGRRLVESGRLRAPEHLFETAPAELAEVLAGSGPGAGELDARAERRSRNLVAPAPDALGREEPLPPLGPLPAALRRVATASLLAYEMLETAATAGGDTGTGIGDEIVRGRARVASDPRVALDLLEPGDVLVVPFTTPAYNAVLPIVSGLVVEEGGAFSHAALVARELGIPAVIGLRGATRAIPDASTVELDPRAGRVTVVD